MQSVNSELAYQIHLFDKVVNDHVSVYRVIGDAN